MTQPPAPGPGRAEPAGPEAQPEWWFYHLSGSRPEQVVAPLIQKCLETGWRVLAVSPDPERLARLDEVLWTFDDVSFLPHGQADAPGIDPARQPVLLARDVRNLNQAGALLLMDAMDAPAQSGFRRCMVLFTDTDHASRDRARSQYRSARQAGLVTRYFRQSGRGWKEVFPGTDQG